MCFFLSPCNPSGVIMESSYGSAWQRSLSSSSQTRSSFFGSESRNELDKSLGLNYRKDELRLCGISDGEAAPELFVRPLELGDISLRQWLDKPDRVVDEFECLHIFRQILEFVQGAHCQGISVQNVRPSCFVMSSFNHVSFIEFASCSESGSDSVEDCSSFRSPNVKNSCLKLNPVGEDKLQNSGNVLRNFQIDEDRRKLFPMKLLLNLEISWYTSPEEVSRLPSSCASDIYKLGVILFELFCSFSSSEDRDRTMSSLRHRILPPQLLQKWPKEASFCLWLLHPEPSCRPKMSELLQSSVLNDPRDNHEEREAATQIKQSVEEHELLLEFLMKIQNQKQEEANKLQDTVSLLSSDIREVSKYHNTVREKERDRRKEDDLINVSEMNSSDHLGSKKRIRYGFQPYNMDNYYAKLDQSIQLETKDNSENTLLKNSRLMKNLKKFEAAYFLTRSKPLRRSNKGSVVAKRDPKQDPNEDRIGWIDPFLDGLCKYLSFSKFKVRANLKQGDLHNSSSLVCSLGFDRDGELFASAGINKKIKVFECDLLMNENRDIHYPVVEMVSSSKLTYICWNKYIKSQIASSNFEGVVQVWDVSRNQVITEMKEHRNRVWAVDFSSPDPAMLASASDDCSVKLWNVNQEASVKTIKTTANVCSVQFSSEASHFLAFGSADHKIYYYDLRNTKSPWCTLVGHKKTVSYVKFLDGFNIVSSSTDNTIKLWDLSSCPYRVKVDSPVQTYTGHTNVKNFVGLSVAGGYIATGSETNEVFVYHKVFPMPSLSFKFDSTVSTSGCDTSDNNKFISSLCWRGQSSTLVAANSTGNIKILEMV